MESWEQPGQRSTEGKFNKEKEGEIRMAGRHLIDCFLSVSQSALSILSSLSTAGLLCPCHCLKWLFIRKYVAIAVYKIEKKRLTSQTV